MLSGDISSVFKRMKEERVRFVDLQFTDVPGRLQHITLPASKLDADALVNGVPKLDGSSIRGFAEISESDMLLRPDPTTFAVIPWSSQENRTARLICDVYAGFGGARFPRDPRYVATKAEDYAREQGYSLSYWGPEVEFFVFKGVSWNVLSPYRGQSYNIESSEAAWSVEAGYPIRFKEGYYPAPPQDTLMEYRCTVIRFLEDYFGVDCEAHHHEVATAGQCEVDMVRGELVKMADNVMTLKYVAKNVARNHGMVATMMPKPIFGDNASGMHTHVSLWSEADPAEVASREVVNLFYDPEDEYAELSQLGRYFIGGLLEHSRALAAIVAPTTNSYKRLVPGYEAPVFIAWSRGNRSANVRVPVYEKGVESAAKKRVEFRTPDPSCNPYLCFAAIMAAGLDGIRRKVDPGDPVNENIYELTPERRKQLGIGELPGSLKEAIDALKSDSVFLKPIFTQDLIEKVIENGMKEHVEISARPHPYEFYLYFDI